MPKTTEFFVDVINLSCGSLIQRYGPFSERRAGVEKHNILDLIPSNWDVRVMQEKARQTG